MTHENSLANEIHAICKAHEDVERLYLVEKANVKRLHNARKAMKIPEGEEIILLYDDALLNNNKAGFAICAGGLYWKNDWTFSSRHEHLSWEVFAKRKSVKEKDLAVEFTHNDRIGLAAAPSEQNRRKIVALLEKIHALCRDTYLGR